jgi:Icc-related predicted phosphoesterase
MGQPSPLRLAATADLHYSRSSQGKCRFLFSHASRHADFLVVCGDLTHRGLAAEARVLAADLKAFCQVPVIAVLGNHDLEAGQGAEVEAILNGAGVTILDGTTTAIGEIGFAGVCGSAGGFARRHLQSATAEDEPSARLAAALRKLETPHRVALLHFSPVRETLWGEDPTLYAAMGSGRLAAGLEQGGATIAFHGHAHNGAYAARTEGGTPVFNVALPVLHREFPDRPGYVVFQPRTAAAELVAV